MGRFQLEGEDMEDSSDAQSGGWEYLQLHHEELPDAGPRWWE